MIGTINSSAAAIASMALAMVPVAADNLVLESDARLSGTVRSIAEDGSVELESPLSPEPLRLKGQSVRRVNFSSGAGVVESGGSRLELANGDVLSGSVTSLDAGKLTLESPAAGELVIPREAIKTLQLGIRASNIVYSGPGHLDQWSGEGVNLDNWTFEDGDLVVQGGGKISQNINCPRQFSIHFTMSWRNHPNFQLFFADPLAPANKETDRYCLQFSASGLEVRRESAGKRHSMIVPTLNRTPDQFAGNRIKVEIRVDRVHSLLYLYLNGESEGRYRDLIPIPPSGGGITMVSNASSETEQRIEELEIREWDEASDRHRSEDRGDVATDVLIERRGDRYSGKLLEIRATPDGPLFSFKSDFQEEPVILPESEVSTVFFARPASLPEAIKSFPFVLRLRGGDSLRVSSCSFSGDRVIATHPVLGALSLRHDGVTTLERLPRKP